MTKANKSPVVYWTSQWEETGKLEVCVDKNGDKYTRPQLKLIGERNSNWKSIATRH